MDESKRHCHHHQHHQTLPDDVIISEILPLLPLKSIGRLRCVSKHFHSLTTDPTFLLSHYSSSSPTSSFIFPFKSPHLAYHLPLSGSHTLPDPYLSCLDHHGRPPLLHDSSHGLLLLRPPSDSPRSLCLLNPTTRSHRFVPFPAARRSANLHLLFDPSLSPHFRILSVRDGPVGYMSLYSSATCYWSSLLKKLRQSEFSDVDFRIKSVKWGGKLVWNGGCGRPHAKTLVCLDAETEELSRLPKPDFDELHDRTYLGEAGGGLHYVGESLKGNFRIWEMRRGSTEGSWKVLYSINIHPGIEKFRQKTLIRGYVSISGPGIVSFLRGKEGDQLLLSMPGKIVCYHVQDRTFSTLRNDVVPSIGTVFTWDRFYTYSESLFTL